ncbi:MAG: glutathione-disulfide reductase [Oligoflexales bacterium]
MRDEFDLIVIGAGSGGVRASRIAASYGAKVAVVEERFAGGTCVNVGCVPKKLFVYSAEVGEALRHAQGYGWNAEGKSFSWDTLRDQQLKEVARLQAIYKKMLNTAGVEWIDGKASLAGPQEVNVGGVVYRAKKILIACGSRPNRPQIPGIEKALVSDHMFSLEKLPQSAIVLGGGYIGVEFAGILNAFGVKVTLVMRKDTVLNRFDNDVRHHVHNCVQARGVQMVTHEKLQEILEHKNGFEVKTDKGTYTADLVLNALGRVAYTEQLGLENTEITTNAQGHIEVDSATFQTKEPSVYAVGDVTGGLQLTPVALAEGMAFAQQHFGDIKPAFMHVAVPTAVFSQPEIGTVGMTEEAASLQCDIDVYMSQFKPLSAALSGSQEKVLMKLIVEQKTEKILGLHMVGPHAGEMLQGFAVGVTAGMTKNQMDQTVGIHPTMAEEFVTMREPTRSVQKVS